MMKNLFFKNKKALNNSTLGLNKRRFFKCVTLASLYSQLLAKTDYNNFFISCKESRIENNQSFYGCFYLGPFDESLSQTLANDLRRTLLSELTGIAITSVEIEGVLHKFSSLPGIKENVLDIICNLQNIVLKKSPNLKLAKKAGANIKERLLQKTLNSDPPLNFRGVEKWSSTESFTQKNAKERNAELSPLVKTTYVGYLKTRGPKVVRASDLKLPLGIQCVDPEQYIATLAEDGILNMKFYINEGKNYIKQNIKNAEFQTPQSSYFTLNVSKSSAQSALSTKNDKNQTEDASLIIQQKDNFSGSFQISKGLHNSFKSSDVSRNVTNDEKINQKNDYAENNGAKSQFSTKRFRPFNFLTKVPKALSKNGVLGNFTYPENLSAKTATWRGGNSDSEKSEERKDGRARSPQIIPTNIKSQKEAPLIAYNCLAASDKTTLEGLVLQKQEPGANRLINNSNNSNNSSELLELLRGAQETSGFIAPANANESGMQLNPFINSEMLKESLPELKKDLEKIKKQLKKLQFLQNKNVFKSKNLNNTNKLLLDAVFMPVTKVNCIIEDNNLHSLYLQNEFPFKFMQMPKETERQSLGYATKSIKKSNEKPYLESSAQPINTLKNSLITSQRFSFLNNSVKTRSALTNNASSFTNTIFKKSKSFIQNKDGLFNYTNNEYGKIFKLKQSTKKCHIILEIWTNGSIHPRIAMYESFKFLSGTFLKLQKVKMLGSMFTSANSYAKTLNKLFLNKNIYSSLSPKHLRRNDVSGSEKRLKVKLSLKTKTAGLNPKFLKDASLKEKSLIKKRVPKDSAQHPQNLLEHNLKSTKFNSTKVGGDNAFMGSDPFLKEVALNPFVKRPIFKNTAPVFASGVLKGTDLGNSQFQFFAGQFKQNLLTKHYPKTKEKEDSLKSLESLNDPFGIKKAIKARNTMQGRATHKASLEVSGKTKKPIENYKISVLSISMRSYKALEKENIKTLGDLLKYTKNELLKLKNFGIKSLSELEEELYRIGLHLKS